MGGNVLLDSMRPIAAGEELIINYVLSPSGPGFALNCRCQRPGLRKRYSGMVLLVAQAGNHADRKLHQPMTAFQAGLLCCSFRAPSAA
jgi:hypothetical protein